MRPNLFSPRGEARETQAGQPLLTRLLNQPPHLCRQLLELRRVAQRADRRPRGPERHGAAHRSLGERLARPDKPRRVELEQAEHLAGGVLVFCRGGEVAPLVRFEDAQNGAVATHHARHGEAAGGAEHEAGQKQLVAAADEDVEAGLDRGLHVREVVVRELCAHDVRRLLPGRHQHALHAARHASHVREVVKEHRSRRHRQGKVCEHLRDGGVADRLEEARHHVRDGVHAEGRRVPRQLDRLGRSEATDVGQNAQLLRPDLLRTHPHIEHRLALGERAGEGLAVRAADKDSVEALSD
mmetsp:Transcript_34742/g.111598  ORF Transcript_34742/g.111598 Transcript_34742/m.111598 type:complete len:297 (-) Transcript_34742:152-1042(-)